MEWLQFNSINHLGFLRDACVVKSVNSSSERACAGTAFIAVTAIGARHKFSK